MARFEITEAADRDLVDIYRYTLREHGEQQADRYLHSIEELFHRLAQRPLLARSANRLRQGYRRFEHGSHVVFFVMIDNGIRIVRVLHRRMDAKRHLS